MLGALQIAKLTEEVAACKEHACKHEGIKTRYEEQVKALKEEVAAKNEVGALRPLCVCARWDGLAKPL